VLTMSSKKGKKKKERAGETKTRHRQALHNKGENTKGAQDRQKGV